MLNLPRDRKLAMITVYDHPTACAFDTCAFDFFLVGDSGGMVELGLKDTKTVTMDMMLGLVAAVKRGTSRTHIIADMPIRTYDTPPDALANAMRFLEAGADSVKVEGPCLEVIRYLHTNRIEVLGHTGLTPQTATSLKMKGTTPEDAARLKREAADIAAAGCYALILEHMPARLAQDITRNLSIPTIGIGAGPHTGGQVIVSSDLLGLSEKVPPFAKKYADLRYEMIRAGRQYITEVRDGSFPSPGYYK
ncbi:MAG: 3-methyl-2-oxobutanoate hydroxymethyltransferase [Planctomycetota bacterium]